MATATRQPNAKPKVAVIDDSAEADATIGGEGIQAFIDEESMRDTPEAAASKRNRAETRPYRQYQKRVIEKAKVPNTHQTRQITSHICGAVARMPFVPDAEEKIKDPFGNETTEFEQQVIKTAQLAESQLGSEMVWTTSAMKLARAALDLRAEDPDGTKGIAWVNDTLADEANVLDD